MGAEPNLPPLLRLPGELRNEIYRYVFVSSPPVRVAADGFEESRFLLACKQIRMEGIKIFYAENSFLVPINDYDSSTLLKWSKFAQGIQQKYAIKVKCACPLNGQTPHWENLKLWLKRAYYAADFEMKIVSPAKLPAHASTQLLVIGGMFKIVEGMLSIPWEKIEPVLEAQHCILVRLDPRWQ